MLSEIENFNKSLKYTITKIYNTRKELRGFQSHESDRDVSLLPFIYCIRGKADMPILLVEQTLV